MDVKQQQQQRGKPSSTSSTSSPKKHGDKGRRQRDSIEKWIATPPSILKQALSTLRYLILVEGLTVPDKLDGQCSYRSYVWSILLRINQSQTSIYLNFVKLGASSAYSKIRNDTFRTLTSDKQFHNKVSEDSLIRVLNAFAWKIEGGKISSHDKYVQGMNVLVAPFLYIAKTESQAFALFDTFLTRDCPLYIQPTLEGVHTGLSLVDICLQIVDPTVYEYLNSKLLSAKIYAFASVLTFSACTPPLTELLALWDFMFAYGCHMNILFVVAQLTLMRDTLLASPSPISLLRSFPALNASEIIKLSVSFVPKLPDKVYDLLARHPYDPSVPSEISKYLKSKK